MTKVSMTFINLPVKDLNATVKFYEALGFSFNPQFTDDTATCLIINETTCAMLLTHERFKGFSKAPIPDAKATAGVAIALLVGSKQEVDDLVTKALASGGSEPTPPNVLPFMYQRTFADPDGHRWEPFQFDMSKIPQQ